MQTTRTLHGNARTFLVHMFGRGLEDDRYDERFKSMTNGDIHSLSADGPPQSAARTRCRRPW